ncbi:MAG TPA: hypothetical protein VEY12_05035 [Thermoplasmata archaeon]|nr:hypothetical protein [Thermoplasmata archaeon]
MQPSGGSSPLPASPLPPSPYQQTYSPTSGLTFAPSPAGAPPASQPTPRKGPPKVAVVVFVLVFVVAILIFSGALDSLLNPAGSSSNQPSVKVTNTSASHSCPYSGTPTETFLFTLVNSGSVNAAASIGFYLNNAQVTSGTYHAAAGASTPYSVTAYLTSCPPSGSTYYLDVLSVTAA